MTPKTAAKMMQECADLTRADTKASQLYAAEVAEQEALKAAGGLASEKTLRDEFAEQALAALKEEDFASDQRIAKAVYGIADAMLEARKTTGEGE
jgi:hypothetical protein